MSDIDLIEYGEMRAAVQQLTRTVASLEITVSNMNNIMQQASGGWKTIITVGSVGGIVGSFGTWIATHVNL